MATAPRRPARMRAPRAGACAVGGGPRRLPWRRRRPQGKERGRRHELGEGPGAALPAGLRLQGPHGEHSRLVARFPGAPGVRASAAVLLGRLPLRQRPGLGDKQPPPPRDPLRDPLRPCPGSLAALLSPHPPAVPALSPISGNPLFPQTARRFPRGMWWVPSSLVSCQSMPGGLGSLQTHWAPFGGTHRGDSR